MSGDAKSAGAAHGGFAPRLPSHLQLMVLGLLVLDDAEGVAFASTSCRRLLRSFLRSLQLLDLSSSNRLLALAVRSCTSLREIKEQPVWQKRSPSAESMLGLLRRNAGTLRAVPSLMSSPVCAAELVNCPRLEHFSQRWFESESADRDNNSAEERMQKLVQSCSAISRLELGRLSGLQFGADPWLSPTAAAALIAVRPLRALVLHRVSLPLLAAVPACKTLSALEELRVGIVPLFALFDDTGFVAFSDLAALVSLCRHSLRTLELQTHERYGRLGQYADACRQSEPWQLPELLSFASDGPFPRLAAPKLASARLRAELLELLVDPTGALDSKDEAKRSAFVAPASVTELQLTPAGNGFLFAHLLALSGSLRALHVPICFTARELPLLLRSLTRLQRLRCERTHHAYAQDEQTWQDAALLTLPLERLDMSDCTMMWTWSKDLFPRLQLPRLRFAAISTEHPLEALLRCAPGLVTLHLIVSTLQRDGSILLPLESLVAIRPTNLAVLGVVLVLDKTSTFGADWHGEMAADIAALAGERGLCGRAKLPRLGTLRVRFVARSHELAFGEGSGDRAWFEYSLLGKQPELERKAEGLGQNILDVVPGF